MQIAASPHQTIIPWRMAITSPGKAAAGTGFAVMSTFRGPNSFTSTPCRVENAAGLGSYDRIVRQTSSTPALQSICASVRVTLRA